MADLIPPLKPIAIKEQFSILFIDKGHLDVLNGAFVVVDKSVFPTRVGMNRSKTLKWPS
jgi:CRISPR-associated protein Cas1